MTFDSFSGLNRCGKLMLVASTLAAGERFLLESTWQAGTWSAFSRFPVENPAYAFEGLGHDGKWYVAWMEPESPINAGGSATFKAVISH